MPRRAAHARLVLAAALLAPLACTGGDQPDAAAARAVVLTHAEQGAAAALDADTLLTLRLPAQGSSGYGWQVAAIDPAVLTLLDRAQESDGSLGGADVEVLHFAGVGPGHTALTLSYRRPWAAPDAADPLYTVEVDVAAAYAGSYRPRRAAARAAAVELLGAAPSRYDVCDPGDGSHRKCTPVKDQRQCGGCWAFATTGVVENLMYLADASRVPDLSEQYLISCNTRGWSCAKGGSIAFDHYIDVYKAPETTAGAVYEADFPFQAQDVACGSVAHPHHEKLTRWASVSTGGAVGSAQAVAALKQAILDHGPLWVSVCADDAFKAWSGGAVFQGDGCTEPNHAVVLTGWDDGGGAWIMRNSWGFWGEAGYMRIAWGANVIGGDAAYAVLPALALNTPPIANAGAAQQVSAGATVTLDGSASHDAESAITYAWSQLSGPGVTLSGASSAHPTFTAPAVAADAALTFQLQVTDAAGAHDTATTGVTVKAPVTPGGGKGAATGVTAVTGGCASGGAAAAWALLGLVALAGARRRGLTPAPAPAKPGR